MNGTHFMYLVCLHVPKTSRYNKNQAQLSTEPPSTHHDIIKTEKEKHRYYTQNTTPEKVSTRNEYTTTTKTAKKNLKNMYKYLTLSR